MKNDLAEMRPPTEPKPTAQAMNAAVAINSRIDSILGYMGVENKGVMDPESHKVTARMIDAHSNLPLLIDALAHARSTLETQLAFWSKASAATNTKMARDMAELCQVTIALIDNTTKPQ